MDITRAMLQGSASESLENVMESVSSADAAIFVTPTERHSLALEFAVRPLFAYLRAVALPTGVLAATGDWGAAGAPTGGARERGLADRVDQAAGELAAAPAGSVGRSAAPVMSAARS